MKSKRKSLAETGRKATVSYPGAEPVVKGKEKKKKKGQKSCDQMKFR